MAENEASAPPVTRPTRAVERHLVIVHQPGWQSIDDWVEIGGHVRRIDPGTDVFIVAADRPGDELAASAAERPTLIFSPGALGQFKPLRGKAYHGRTIEKFEQLRRLSAAGVPVPRTQLLGPDMRLDPKDWGDVVVVKPTRSSLGEGVQLMRTERVRYVAPHDYPDGHPGRRGPMLVQKFIDTGERISAFRVLSLFGQPLMCLRYVSHVPRIGLDADDVALEKEPVATHAQPARSREFIYDADVVAVVRRTYDVFPEVPLQGVDVLRDVSTGRLYVLEINPKGNTWHFSSNLLRKAREEVGPSYLHGMKTQLDAFRNAAHILAAVTRREAV